MRKFSWNGANNKYLNYDASSAKIYNLKTTTEVLDFAHVYETRENNLEMTTGKKTGILKKKQEYVEKKNGTTGKKNGNSAHKIQNMWKNLVWGRRNYQRLLKTVRYFESF